MVWFPFAKTEMNLSDTVQFRVVGVIDKHRGRDREVEGHEVAERYNNIVLLESEDSLKSACPSNAVVPITSAMQ